MRDATIIAGRLAAAAMVWILVSSAAAADEKGNRDEREGAERLCQGIPCGHLPPPGECRAWIPGKPAGQQPPPGNCRKVEAEAPAGAWIIRGEKR